MRRACWCFFLFLEDTLNFGSCLWNWISKWNLLLLAVIIRLTMIDYRCASWVYVDVYLLLSMSIRNKKLAMVNWKKQNYRRSIELIIISDKTIFPSSSMLDVLSLFEQWALFGIWVTTKKINSLVSFDVFQTTLTKSTRIVTLIKFPLLMRRKTKEKKSIGNREEEEGGDDDDQVVVCALASKWPEWNDLFCLLCTSSVGNIIYFIEWVSQICLCFANQSSVCSLWTLDFSSFYSAFLSISSILLLFFFLQACVHTTIDYSLRRQKVFLSMSTCFLESLYSSDYYYYS